MEPRWPTLQIEPFVFFQYPKASCFDGLLGWTSGDQGGIGMVEVREVDAELAGLHQGLQQVHGLGDEGVLDLGDVPVRELVGGVEGGVQEGEGHLLFGQDVEERLGPSLPGVGVGHVEDGVPGAADEEGHGVAVLVGLRHLSATSSEGDGR